MAGRARHFCFYSRCDSEPDVAEVEVGFDADIEEPPDRIDRIGRLADRRLLIEQVVDAGVDVPAARKIVADLNALHEAVGNEQELLRKYVGLILDRLERG